jgi:hypothetical protein
MSDMSLDRKLLIAMLIVFVAYIVYNSYSNKENFKVTSQMGAYNNNPLATDESNNALFAQPTFKADLSPRFDAVTPGSIYVNPPPVAYQASPITPVSQMDPQSSIPSQYYQQQIPSQYYQQQIPTNFEEMGADANSTLTSDQVMNIQNKIGSGTPVYQETTDVMPLPDMKGAVMTVDPTDPNNFIYDRTIFAPLKRRYGADVDYFRGDIMIPQQQRGWFDISPASQNDVVKGYFENYIDIQQATQVQDSLYERTLTQEQKLDAKLNQFGNTEKLPYEYL